MNTMLARCVVRSIAEGWDTNDMRAACLQASLLSYRSSVQLDGRSEEWFFQTQQPHQIHRYVSSSPEDYAHNCPWNDWPVPSQSRLRFQTAAAASTAESSVPKRVRVRLCTADKLQMAATATVVFASVESRSDLPALILRRGAQVLGEFCLTDITLSPIISFGLPSIILGPRSGCQHAICMIFEDGARFNNFCRMTNTAVTKISL